MTQALGVNATASNLSSPRPARARHAGTRTGVADRTLPQLVAAISTAPDVTAGLENSVDLLSRASLGDQVEWWRPTADGQAFRLVRRAGASGGARSVVPIGPLGVLLVGERCATYLTPAVVQLVPVLRRRWEADQLVELASALARRNEALQDFAALVAHEVKRPLLAALVAVDCKREITTALDIVDSLLEAARDTRSGGAVSTSDCLDHVLMELGPVDVRISRDLPRELPLSATTLRLVLRNLITNAVAAGAGKVHVRARRSGGRWLLTVDDDGVGLSREGYVSGSGVGLSLTRRFLSRQGLTLRLESRAPRGTRARLEWRDDR